MKILQYRNKLICILLIMFTFMGCAATSDHEGKLIGAGVGAGLGALIAEAAGLDPALGAAIGAGAGLLAGAIYDYNVKQTKQAPEVEEDYKNKHNGQLPAETIITHYSTRTDPSSVVKRGSELNFYSDIEVIKGTNVYARQDAVQEELIIYNDPQGLEPIKSKKDVDIDPNHSGAYETKLAFKFRPDDNLNQGHYDYKKILYLNNAPVREVDGRFQVVFHNQLLKIVFLE
ncbi:MAG: hypothetical protein H6936_00595 [Burkholderiales bacterium]|nr:hypothetical protein [Nitrosomonas sp.]MCP5273354.1 hypothetical protein [Burkholderiales bacterium]